MTHAPLQVPISLALKVRVEFHVVAEINGKEKARGWKQIRCTSSSIGRAIDS